MALSCPDDRDGEDKTMSPVRADGDDATILFLHPVGLDRECWREAAEGLPGRALDLPGHGASSAIPVPATMSELAAFVLADIHAPVHLIGASLGAFISLQAAVDHPDLVRSVVAITAAGALDAATMRQRAAALRMDGTGSSLDTTLSRWFSGPALEQGDHPGIEYACKRLSANPIEPIAAMWDAMATYNVTDRLSDVSVPVSCVYATDDVSTPPAAAKKLVERLPRSRLDELNGPHMILLESPKAIRGAIARHFDWLSQNRNASRYEPGRTGAKDV
jgi:pimeloyl-ACP methyl ester carboxylesterase